MFRRLWEFGLKVHPGKCVSGAESIDFLGYHISVWSLQPQDKLATVRDLPPPTYVSSLRLALGLFSYYKQFVNRFSTLAFPLNKLLKKAKRWVWGEEQRVAFVRLKEELCNATVLKLSDHYKPYILTTDWSQWGMEAVLSQLDPEMVEYPVAYASRSCNPAEQNYDSFDCECLVVVQATTHFRQYLFSNPFTLVTDHEPVRWILTTQKLTWKLARWSLLL